MGWIARLIGIDNAPGGVDRTVLGCNVFTIAGDEFIRLRVYFNAPDFG